MSAIRVAVLAVLGAIAASASPFTGEPLLTVGGDPDDYVIGAGTVFDGVAKLYLATNLGGFGCSGTLVLGGSAILTAGHCLWNTHNGSDLLTSSVTAVFPDNTLVTSTKFQWHPDWDRSLSSGTDIGLIWLDDPLALPYYAIATARPAAGSEVQIAGYGVSGTGATGHKVGGAPGFGTLRVGTNQYDAVFTNAGVPFAYAFDFDNGDAARSSIGGAAPTAAEVLTVPGDSGGPTFIWDDGNLVIVGVHSFYMSLTNGTDLDTELNGTFGELGGDTMVADCAAWVNSPEPASALLVLAGLALAAVWKRRAV